MPFGSLPLELRSYIWSLTAETRFIINVHPKKSSGKFTKKERQQGKDVLCETTSTPAPAVMHACHESRRYAPYKRVFTRGTQPRWTWINFEFDIFCVTSVYNVEDLRSYRTEVQRLHVRTVDDWDWYESVTHGSAVCFLSGFTGLRDVRIFLERDLFMWGDVWANWGLDRCPGDVVSFVDEKSRLALTGPQIQLLEDWTRVFAFGSRGNPPDPDRLEAEIENALDESWHLTMEQIREIG